MTLLVIGLDAAELTIINRLMEQGRLPTISHLLQNGTTGRMRSPMAIFEGMNWDRWLEGRNVSKRYHHKVWRPDRMGYALSWTKEYLPRQPFWQDVAAAGAKVGAMDLHFVRDHKQEDVAWLLNGWQLTSNSNVIASPSALATGLKAEFGPPIMRPETYGRQSAGGLLALRLELLAATEQAARLVAKTLREEQFDLFVMTLGAVHAAGHYLWDLSQIDAALVEPDDLRKLENALDEIYVETDRALARILEAAPAGSTTILFATYGMTVNDGWAYKLDAMVERIAVANPSGAPRSTALGKLKNALPIETLMAAGRGLPHHVRDHLVQTLSPRFQNWSHRRFLAVPGEPHGFIRINLKGREAQGAVEPGAQYEDALAMIEGALRGFVDRTTGMPVVERVLRIDDLLPGSVPERPWLPDLALEFTNSISAQDSDGVSSARYGDVRWEKGVPHLSGRAGNHNKSAWYTIVGPGFERNRINEAYDPIDMAPSIISLMNLVPDTRFDGRVMAPLVAKHIAPANMSA